MINDIIIIGSGISGLNIAYQLLKDNPKLKILILEKNNYIGGRIKTETYKIKSHTYRYEEGAGRFNDNHKLLHNLIKELGLEDNIIKINADISFYPSTAYNEKYLHKSPFQYINIVIKESKKENIKTLQKYTFIEYAKTVLDEEDVKFILDSFGYYAQLVKMNAYNALKLFNDGMNPNLNFYTLNNGLSSIIDNLSAYIIRDNGKILLDNYVSKVEYSNMLFNVYSNDKIYRSKNCIMAIPKPDLLKFTILKDYKPLIKSINTKSLCRIYAIFDKKDIWFKDISKSTTNNNSRYIIPIDKKNGLIMIAYSDSKFANYWNKLENTNEELFKNRLKDNIYKTFNKKIADPIYLKKCYWTLGTGFWRKNIDSKIVSKKMIQPNTTIPLYICGENYSENQGWIEGALETSYEVIKKIKF